MIEPAHPEPRRKIDAVTRELLTIDGQRTVRVTRMYSDATTGEPLGVRVTEQPMPPMVAWQDEAAITENPNKKKGN